MIQTSMISHGAIVIKPKCFALLKTNVYFSSFLCYTGHSGCSFGLWISIYRSLERLFTDVHWDARNPRFVEDSSLVSFLSHKEADLHYPLLSWSHLAFLQSSNNFLVEIRAQTPPFCLFFLLGISLLRSMWKIAADKHFERTCEHLLLCRLVFAGRVIDEQEYETWNVFFSFLCSLETAPGFWILDKQCPRTVRQSAGTRASTARIDRYSRRSYSWLILFD